MRIGHGYDVHRLVEGRKLILGGVDIPYEKVNDTKEYLKEVLGSLFTEFKGN